MGVMAMTDSNTEFVEAVFEEVERDRKSGALRKLIHAANPDGAYGVPKQYPNHIGKYNSDVNLVAIGHYKDGDFVASEVFIDE